MSICGPTNDRRTPVIVLANVSVLVAIAGCIGVGTYGYHQLFLVESRLRDRDESAFAIWRGEIIFCEQRVKFNAGPVGPIEVMAYDPRTGNVHSTGINVPAGAVRLIVHGDRLWIVSSTEVVEAEGKTVKRWTPQQIVNLSKLAASELPLFVLDGALTTVVSSNQGPPQLHSLIEGEWQPGRRIVVLGNVRKWEFDAERNQRVLVPLTEEETSEPDRLVVAPVEVLQIEGDVHVVTDDGAFRTGLDFLPGSPDAPSALVPENVRINTAGWYKPNDEIQLPKKLVNVDGKLGIATDQPPYLWISVAPQPARFLRAELKTRLPERLLESTNTIVGSDDGNDVYFVLLSLMESLRFFRLEGNEFSTSPLYVPGCGELLLDWELRVLALLLCVFVLSHSTVLVGAIRMARSRRADQYLFGRDTVTLGPLARRWLARGIDLMLIALPLTALVGWITSTLTVDELVVYQVVCLECVFGGPDLQSLLEFANASQESSPEFFILLWLYFQTSCAVSVAIFAVSILGQAYRGMTLGKWICGLRVVRTTLRPCGLLRSLLRELLLCVDTLCLISPLPGVMAILLTDARQRLGDLVADTVVIDAASLPRHPT